MTPVADPLTYETIARFAQQGGLVYFSAIFLAGAVYALRPSKKAEFNRAARLPLEDGPLQDGPNDREQP